MNRFCWLVVAVGMLAGTSACGSYPTAGSGCSSDSVRSCYCLEGKGSQTCVAGEWGRCVCPGEIVESPEPPFRCDRVLDFGLVAIGDRRQLSVTCTNATAHPRELVLGDLGGPDPRSFEVPSPEYRCLVDSGDSCFVPVTFLADHDDLATAELELGPEGRTPEVVTLTGTAISPAISCWPPWLDFSDAGFLEKRSIICHNAASVPYRITGAWLASGSSSSRSSFKWDEDFPIEVAPGGAEETRFDVTFAHIPQGDSGAPITAGLVLSTDDPSRPLINTALNRPDTPYLYCWQHHRLDFGRIPAGECVVQSFDCTNLGRSTLFVDEVVVSSPWFTTSAAWGLDPSGYEQDEPFSFSVTYCPSGDTNGDFGSMTIRTNAVNAANHPRYTVELLGRVE